MHKVSIDDYTWREIVAYHEAGHAVVAWSLSITIYEIGINEGSGYVRDGLRWVLPEDMRLGDEVRHAQILWGGELAERMLHDYCEAEYDPLQSMALGANGDHKKIQELATYFHEEGAAEWIEEMKSAADEIILKNWHSIVALATALGKVGVLRGHDAERIIAKSLCCLKS